METLHVTYHAIDSTVGDVEETFDLVVQNQFAREIIVAFDNKNEISKIYVSGPVWVNSSGRSSQMLLMAVRMIAYLKGQGFVSIVSVKTI